MKKSIAYLAAATVCWGCGNASSFAPVNLPLEGVVVETLQTGSSPLFVHVADLNGDGRDDILASDRTGNRLQLLAQTSGSTFVQPQEIALPASPAEARSADLDGDGKVDIAVALRSSSQVGLLMGTGGGQFAPLQVLVPGAGPQGLRIVDLDQDGRFDLVVSNVGSNNLSLFFGQPGGFSAPLTLAAGTNPVQVEIGDFNNDGRPDVAASNFGAGSVSLYLNLGSRNFATSTLTAGPGAFGLLATDLNRDGRDDLLVANEQGDSMTRFLQVDQGQLDGGSSFPVGVRPDLMVARDFTGDGFPEIFVTLEGEDGVALLEGKFDGSQQRVQLFATDGGPVGIAGGVFSNGKLFLVTANFFGNGLSLFRF